MLTKPIFVTFIPASAGQPAEPGGSFCTDDSPPSNGSGGGGGGSSGGGTGANCTVVPNCGPSGCFPFVVC